jgi:hypothetical protein
MSKYSYYFKNVYKDSYFGAKDYKRLNSKQKRFIELFCAAYNNLNANEFFTKGRHLFVTQPEFNFDGECFKRNDFTDKERNLISNVITEVATGVRYSL